METQTRIEAGKAELVTLERAWQEFRAAALPVLVPAPEYAQARRAFLSGALSALMLELGMRNDEQQGGVDLLLALADEAVRSGVTVDGFRYTKGQG